MREQSFNIRGGEVIEMAHIKNNFSTAFLDTQNAHNWKYIKYQLFYIKNSSWLNLIN